MGTIWSNGRLCNVKHRVKCIDPTVRFSIASFLLGPIDRDLEAPDELVDAEHPRLYKPISDGGLRKIRLSMNLHAGESLKFITMKADLNDVPKTD
ncbi:2-oxoglutarate-dependent dioxygenase DAO [Cardamine amara subsp. amara]|uniref:2-oxoglutarate-dependent dioxygenase DAO n=1 Tax=Cardamine amara subsp. amara TaxID=228776 RepID=A0ABD1AUT4_CARAN